MSSTENNLMCDYGVMTMTLYVIVVVAVDMNISVNIIISVNVTEFLNMILAIDIIGTVIMTTNNMPYFPIFMRIFLHICP